MSENSIAYLEIVCNACHRKMVYQIGHEPKYEVRCPCGASDVKKHFKSERKHNESPVCW